MTRLVQITMPMFVGILSTSTQAVQYIEGYTGNMSYLPGETIAFHVSTDSPTYSIEIMHDGALPQTLVNMSGLTGSFHPVPAQYAWRGANWPVTHTWQIPGTTETGAYLARFVTEDGSYRYHPFTVRKTVPGSRSRIAFVMNYCNRNAYNRWGGKSVYFSSVPGDPTKANRVSFRRPILDQWGRGKGYAGQRPLYRYLEAAGHAPEYITERDIHADPNLTRSYDVLVLAGHHEYVSRPILDAFESHRDRGGHLAFFSGNDIYWQVRIEDAAQTLVCYKATAIPDDPLYNVNNDLLTGLWSAPPLNRPGEALQGVAFVFETGAFESEPYLVQDGSHWIFAGTGLQTGDPLGEEMAISETDYLGPASPPGLDLILYARRDRVIPGHVPKYPFIECAAVYYEKNPAYGFPGGRGGQVFSSGSEIGWAQELDPSRRDFELVGMVTSNIVQHMLAAPPAPMQGDEDNSGVTDLEDFVAFETCYSGSQEEPGFVAPGVWCMFVFDEDVDGDVDQGDFATFLSYYTGPIDDCNVNGVSDLSDIIEGTSPDCNLTGVPDECEVDAGTSTDCEGSNIPDECEPDCNTNGVTDLCDISSGTSLDCNTNQVPDECEPDLDCNGNSIQDICDLAAGTSNDCNENAIPDECEPPTDCNMNGAQDFCDLFVGTSLDCNDNKVPDECEPDEDCNLNTVQDICDIAAGTSMDCNSNGVPDECDPDGDGDQVADDCDNCTITANSDQQDADEDAVGDACDNCPTVPNPGQENADADQHGDVCDGLADISHDGAVDLNDFLMFAACLGSAAGNPVGSCSVSTATDSDMNGDGVVNLGDFLTFAANFGQ